MAQQTINIGTVADDGTGDTYRDAFDKSNDNFDEIYASSVSTNVIAINSVSDYAVQDAETITLEDDKTYVIAGTIESSKRYVVGKRVAIGSANPGGFNLLSYTGSGDMFTGVDSEFFHIVTVSLRCPLGQAFNFSDTVQGTTLFNMRLVTFQSATPGALSTDQIGTFNNIASVLFDFSNNTLVGTGTNQGIKLLGTIGIVSITRFAMLSPSASFIALDLGTAVVDVALEVLNVPMIGTTAGSIGIKGLASSANIDAAIVGLVRSCEFLSNITPLNGVSISDLRLEFQDNSGLESSSKSMDTFLTSTETVAISSAGVFVPINGTNWSSDISERFSTTSTGIGTYDSPINSKSLVITTATVAKVGGGADEIEVKIAINGTVIDKTVSSTDNASPTSVTSQGIFTLTATDTIQVFVANIDSTSNIEVSSATMTIINGF